MNIKPIPKNLLIHTIVYHERLPDDRYGGGYKAPVTILNTLVVPSFKVKKSGANEEKEYKARLMMDVINTLPIMELVFGSKIVFDGKEYFVQKVTPVFGFKLHHYEVDLT